MALDRAWPDREDWIRYLLVREISVRFPDRELEIETEVGGSPQVDLSIRGLFSVELKGPHSVEENFDEGIYREFLEDVRNQHDRAKNDPNPKHFVLLILHAPKKDFDGGCFKRMAWPTGIEGSEK